jgi:hypothetical protein
MISEDIYVTSMNVAAELLKTLKRDVPFETEKDILDAHARLTQALYNESNRFQGQANSTLNTSSQQLEVPKTVPSETKLPENKAAESKEGQVVAPTPATATKAITTSEPAVLAMVQKAVDAVATKEGAEELKAKVLRATKISLQDQSMLLAKLDAKIGAM